MYESFEPWHLRGDYKVKKVHAHSPPLSKKSPFSIGDTSSEGSFSIAMLVYQRVQ